jgi:CheY-like chemotaxis protein
MPEMDGIETAMQLRELPLHRMPHMTMVTAYGREDIIRGAEEAGIEDVLIKPVSASVLFESVVRILGDSVDGGRIAGDISTDAVAQLATIRGARILLVEDNELNQEVASELLRDVGLSVELAENGQIALDKIRSSHYDIVLMDMQMPVMDGVTATQAIRRDVRFRNLPIVAMTANAMEGDRERCMLAGMNDHVAKPIEPEDLWKALLKWIKPHDPKSPANVIARVTPDSRLPSDIQHLDMADGLRRVLGKKPLYLWMLRKFITGQRNAITEIRAALEANDWNSAERLAHTLKGVAGNIGATRLPELAKRTETAIREHQSLSMIDICLKELAYPLASLIADLEHKLPKERRNVAVSIDLKLLTAVCDQLEALLVSDDSAASDVLDTNSDLLNAAFPNHYHKINDSIRSLNFEMALAALRAATGTSKPTAEPVSAL